MAATQGEKSTPHSAELVGNAFVEQYYVVLHQSQEQVHLFYKDSSVLSRPDADGKLITMTTLQDIKDKIHSMDYSNSSIEILTVDTQASYQNGLIVLVTGLLSRRESMRRKFMQTFFLAPQENGYYVLNDILMFVDDNKSFETQITQTNNENDSKVVVDVPHGSAEIVAQTMVNITSNPKNDVHKKDEVLPPFVDEETTEKEVVDEVNTDKEVIEEEANDKEVVADALIKQGHDEVPPVADEDHISNVKENTLKKSYASIVDGINRDATPCNPQLSQEKSHSSLSTQTTEPTSCDANKNDNEDKSYTIFITGLLMSATPNQVREVFTRFGSIKPDGAKVRCNKRHVFGFVDYESLDSLQKAVKAKNVMVGGRKVFIEAAKINRDNDHQRNSDKESLPSGYYRFRNDHNRGHRNFGGRYDKYGIGRQPMFSMRNQRNRETQQYIEIDKKFNRNGGESGALQASVA